MLRLVRQLSQKGTTMVSRTVIEMTDDLDGSRADETVKFALDGAEYEIDLSKAHSKDLHDALQPYLKAARKTGGRRGRRDGMGVKEDLHAIRDWAKQQGMKVSERGRISAEVREAYTKAR